MTLQTNLADIPNPSLPSASLLRRMSCWFYEGMLLFGVIFIAGYLFGTLTQTRHAMNNRLGLQVFVFLVLALYFSFFWHKGQTLAMKTWHIRVLDASGQPLTQSRALLRYLLSWVWFLPPIVAAIPLQLPAPIVGLLVLVWVFVWAFSSRFQLRGQYWHDVWAGTQLVDVPKKP